MHLVYYGLVSIPVMQTHGKNIGLNDKTQYINQDKECRQYYLALHFSTYENAHDIL